MLDVLMVFFRKKKKLLKPFDKNCFIIESKSSLADFYKFHEKEKIIENDLDEIHFLEDINSRRKNDSEVLSLVAANAQKGCMLDIGTHVGRSAARMAVNSPGSTIYTVNVHPDDFDKAGILTTEQLSVDQIGSFYRENNLENIIQIFANTFDWEIPSYINNISLAYIDGCHDSQAVYSDTRLIIERIMPGGFILWHDFSPIYRNNFHWIDECMTGIERLYHENLITGPIFNVKHSWIGIWRKPS
jgi:predicted O-methyltransferase YrrM